MHRTGLFLCAAVGRPDSTPSREFSWQTSTVESDPALCFLVVGLMGSLFLCLSGTEGMVFTAHSQLACETTTNTAAQLLKVKLGFKAHQTHWNRTGAPFRTHLGTFL